MEFKDKLLKYKPYIVLVIIILGLITFNIYTLSLVDTTDEEEIIPIKTKEKKVSKIKVDIKGEVNSIGVYELDNDSRVIDLIDKAGGVTTKADTSIINLSKKLEDEMVVIVYSKNEVNKLKNESKSNNITDVCPKINDACPKNEPDTLKEANKKTETSNTKISINSATLEELQKLDGIGKSKAEAIINYREEKGKFKTIEEIKNVSGIGESAFAKIKDNITI